MDILLIIDMQESAFSGSHKFEQDRVISRIQQLSVHVRRYAGKVIYIQHDGNAEEGLLAHTPGWEILSALKPEDTDVIIRKTTNDAFCDTHLLALLQSLSIDRLIICGWATDFCVNSSIRSAISHGFDIVIASDCHTLSDRPHIKAETSIQYHNWLWSELLTLGTTIEVKSSTELLQ